MGRLRATPRGDHLLPDGPPVTIGVGVDGRLRIACDDDDTFDWVHSLLTQRLFVAHQGFPKLQRDNGGQLVRSPETLHYVVVGYADFGSPPEELLGAIEDNLEATDAFRLARVD